MFSGLIEHRGTVVANDESHGGRRLVVVAPDAIRDGVQPKDSVAINGVCLTVVSVGTQRIAFDVVPESLGRSTLGGLVEGDHVNVELSLRLGDRIGGHIVYGHIDATAEVVGRKAEGQGERMLLATPEQLRRYIVDKGYVALDGVSVTIAGVQDGHFEVALVPETLARTTLGVRQTGDRVNVEVDPIARYAIGS
jgi:riboflavin synthase